MNPKGKHDQDDQCAPSVLDISSEEEAQNSGNFDLNNDQIVDEASDTPSLESNRECDKNGGTGEVDPSPKETSALENSLGNIYVPRSHHPLHGWPFRQPPVSNPSESHNT